MDCDGYEAILKDAITSSVEAALRVEPSADLLARVRHQVAEERARPATRRLRWLPALAASVAIAGALLVVAAVRRRAPSTVAESTPAPAPAAPRASSTPEVPVPTRRDVRTAVRTRREPVFGPGVVVERGQAEALARLAASGLAGPRARPAFVVTSLDAEAPLPRLEAVDLPRFEMKPLEPALDTNEGSDS